MQARRQASAQRCLRPPGWRRRRRAALEVLPLLALACARAAGEYVSWYNPYLAPPTSPAQACGGAVLGTWQPLHLLPAARPAAGRSEMVGLGRLGCDFDANGAPKTCNVTGEAVSLASTSGGGVPIDCRATTGAGRLGAAAVSIPLLSCPTMLCLIGGATSAAGAAPGSLLPTSTTWCSLDGGASWFEGHPLPAEVAGTAHAGTSLFLSAAVFDPSATPVTDAPAGNTATEDWLTSRLPSVFVVTSGSWLETGDAVGAPGALLRGGLQIFSSDGSKAREPSSADVPWMLGQYSGLCPFALGPNPYGTEYVSLGGWEVLLPALPLRGPSLLSSLVVTSLALPPGADLDFVPLPAAVDATWSAGSASPTPSPGAGSSSSADGRVPTAVLVLGGGCVLGTGAGGSTVLPIDLQAAVMPPVCDGERGPLLVVALSALADNNPAVPSGGDTPVSQLGQALGVSAASWQWFYQLAMGTGAAGAATSTLLHMQGRLGVGASSSADAPAVAASSGSIFDAEGFEVPTTLLRLTGHRFLSFYVPCSGWLPVDNLNDAYNEQYATVPGSEASIGLLLAVRPPWRGETSSKLLVLAQRRPAGTVFAFDGYASRCNDTCATGYYTQGCAFSPFDAVCYKCTKCSSGQYQVAPCRAAHPRGWSNTRCASCTVCPWLPVASRSPSTSPGALRPSLSPSPYMVQAIAKPCTNVSDTVCFAVTPTSSGSFASWGASPLGAPSAPAVPSATSSSSATTLLRGAACSEEAGVPAASFKTWPDLQPSMPASVVPNKMWLTPPAASVVPASQMPAASSSASSSSGASSSAVSSPSESPAPPSVTASASEPHLRVIEISEPPLGPPPNVSVGYPGGGSNDDPAPTMTALLQVGSSGPEDLGAGAAADALRGAGIATSAVSGILGSWLVLLSLGVLVLAVRKHAGRNLVVGGAGYGPHVAAALAATTPLDAAPATTGLRTTFSKAAARLRQPCSGRPIITIPLGLVSSSLAIARFALALLLSWVLLAGPSTALARVLGRALLAVHVIFQGFIILGTLAIAIGRWSGPRRFSPARLIRVIARSNALSLRVLHRSILVGTGHQEEAVKAAGRVCLIGICLSDMVFDFAGGCVAIACFASRPDWGLTSDGSGSNAGEIRPIAGPETRGVNLVATAYLTVCAVHAVAWIAEVWAAQPCCVRGAGSSKPGGDTRALALPGGTSGVAAGSTAPSSSTSSAEVGDLPGVVAVSSDSLAPPSPSALLGATGATARSLTVVNPLSSSAARLGVSERALGTTGKSTTSPVAALLTSHRSALRGRALALRKTLSRSIRGSNVNGGGASPSPVSETDRERQLSAEATASAAPAEDGGNRLSRRDRLRSMLETGADGSAGAAASRSIDVGAAVEAAVVADAVAAGAEPALAALSPAHQAAAVLPQLPVSEPTARLAPPAEGDDDRDRRASGSSCSGGEGAITSSSGAFSSSSLSRETSDDGCRVALNARPTVLSRGRSGSRLPPPVSEGSAAPEVPAPVSAAVNAAAPAVPAAPALPSHSVPSSSSSSPTLALALSVVGPPETDEEDAVVSLNPRRRSVPPPAAEAPGPHLPSPSALPLPAATPLASVWAMMPGANGAPVPMSVYRGGAGLHGAALGQPPSPTSMLHPVSFVPLPSGHPGSAAASSGAAFGGLRPPPPHAFYSGAGSGGASAGAVANASGAAAQPPAASSPLSSELSGLSPAVLRALIQLGTTLTPASATGAAPPVAPVPAAAQARHQLHYASNAGASGYSFHTAAVTAPPRSAAQSASASSEDPTEVDPMPDPEQ